MEAGWLEAGAMDAFAEFGAGVEKSIRVLAAFSASLSWTGSSVLFALGGEV